jgi:DNA-binding GntR family transcriptional regulator
MSAKNGGTKMKGELKMDVNEYLPLRDVVFNTLRQAILRGEMEPGERLMEIQLAQKLGVSRTPIREAIRKLELEGLVVMIPRKGAEVAHITEKDMRDVLEVRSTLEELAVTLAIQNATDEKIEELRAANKVFESAVVSKDVVNIVDMDVKFHDILYSMTDNARLIQIINNLREQMYRYRLEYVKDARTHSILISEHNDIIREIKDKNVDVARKVIRQHINNQEKGIIRLLNN